MIGTVNPSEGIVINIIVLTAALTASLTGDVNTFTAVGTRTDIELVLLVFELYIEIIKTDVGSVIMITIAGETWL